MKIAVIIGTRPEIIKMAPVIFSLEKSDLDYVFIYTGQHYDFELSSIFFEELGLPPPDYKIELNRKEQLDQISEIIVNLNRIFKKDKKIVISLVHGDTNSTLAGAIASQKSKLYVGHVEAGLRSYDWRMPEEFNRRLTDHLSTFLFAPTNSSKENLIKENVFGHIYVTGNTVIDSINMFLPLAERKSKIMDNIPFKDYALLTAHRAENVDDPFVISNLIKFIFESPIPIVYPIHPRTKNHLIRLNLLDKLQKCNKLKLIKPVGYLDFLILMKNSKFIITDSGGIQEEATSPLIKKPVLVLRWSTERPEAVKTGFAKIVGILKENILKNVEELLNNYKSLIKRLPNTSPFGDGKAGFRIVKILQEEIQDITV